jgi:hypothetical protein
MIHELVQTTYKDIKLAIDKKQVQGTLDGLLEIANKIAVSNQASGQVSAGTYWTFKKTEAKKLSKRLEKEQEQLMVVVGLINA